MAGFLEIKIAEKIIDKGGDYVLALKGNQGTLSHVSRAKKARIYGEASSINSFVFSCKHRCEDMILFDKK